jgi:release factor glutamine methyltransferase
MALSVRAELRAAGAALTAAGAASGRVDAELLLAHVLGCSRSRLLVIDTLSQDQADRFAALVGRRADGVPLQHLTGTAPFRQLELSVGPGVFIPRPETELILELAAPYLRPGGTVVDLCAGSGAIALSVAHEFGGNRVIAVEANQAALGWLRRNAEQQAAAGNPPIEVIEADIGEAELVPELAALTGTVSVLLANPPYVPESVRAQLSAEIHHEPREAVFAGADGLALIPALAELAARLLRPGGFLAIEHDDSHLRSVSELLTGAGVCWRSVTEHADLAGRPRFTTAVRAG